MRGEETCSSRSRSTARNRTALGWCATGGLQKLLPKIAIAALAYPLNNYRGFGCCHVERKSVRFFLCAPMNLTIRLPFAPSSHLAGVSQGLRLKKESQTEMSSAQAILPGCLLRGGVLQPPHVNAIRSPAVLIYQELGHLSSGPITPSNTIAARHIVHRYSPPANGLSVPAHACSNTRPRSPQQDCEAGA